MSTSKKKTGLDNYELQFIKGREQNLEKLFSAIEKVSQFKEGDFLIGFQPMYGMAGRQLITNSYGAPKKFSVIYVDKHGIPYMKELNKVGSPVGQVLSPLHFDSSREVRSDIEFEVDPDYTDAIILDDENNYNATEIMKAKSDAFKAITGHNKAVKVTLNDEQDVTAFLRTVKVGDTLYRSAKTSFTILKLEPAHFRIATIRKDSAFGEAQTSKGKVVSLNFYDFISKAIYTSAPRSYNELKDPK